MQIEIVEIFQGKSIIAGRYGSHDYYAYWVMFKWNNTIGHAYFYPYGSYEGSDYDFQRMNLPLISVETSQKGIENLKKIDKEFNGDMGIYELGEPGNFHVIGKVDCVVRDEDIKVLYYIQVDDCRIDLSVEEIDSFDLDESDIIEFDLIGLSLYDEG